MPDFAGRCWIGMRTLKVAQRACETEPLIRSETLSRSARDLLESLGARGCKGA